MVFVAQNTQVVRNNYFIEIGKDGDDVMSQLHITLYYHATVFDNNEKGHKWFNDPSKSDDIVNFISSLAFLKKINKLQPVKRSISWTYV